MHFDATAIVLALVGLMVGSFLNVCIYRIPQRRSVVRPRSRCASCERPLAWYENIPVASYIALRGRCRTCGARIALRYPIVELATAAAFVLEYAVLGWSPLLPVRIAFACILIVLFAIDLEHQLLPNVITLPALCAGLVAAIALPPGLRDALIGAIVGGGILFLIAEVYFRLRHEEGMGMGDVKMLAMIGAFLGWKLTLLTLILASLGGSLAGVLLLVTRRGNLKAALPFGTFLAAGALAASLFGEPIVAWYLGRLT
ncbi:MAG TPA: A24 family peptidase [Vicinamibacterales bacterium]|jgi:leader peptidase (prepilin peptidase)/N-methyltransferase|nr:A24 family peptidase [Vicinamibacterales bacterium]